MRSRQNGGCTKSKQGHKKGHGINLVEGLDKKIVRV